MSDDSHAIVPLGQRGVVASVSRQIAITEKLLTRIQSVQNLLDVFNVPQDGSFEDTINRIHPDDSITIADGRYVLDVGATIADVISSELFTSVCGGKYSRWAKHLSTGSLETLLSAIGVFGREYHRVLSNYPEREFQPRPLERMKFAIEVLAALQGHRDNEKDYELGCFRTGSNEHGSAFTEVFKNRIGAGDHFTSWAANLSEKQLHMLLWQVGEYACRVSSKALENGGGALPLFIDVPIKSEIVIRNSLVTIAVPGFRTIV
jgi:hypothetical protein